MLVTSHLRCAQEHDAGNTAASIPARFRFNRNRNVEMVRRLGFAELHFPMSRPHPGTAIAVAVAHELTDRRKQSSFSERRSEVISVNA